MNINATQTCSIGCTCDHYAPLLKDAVKPIFNRDLALYWAVFGLSTQALYELILDEVFVHHSGVLHGYDREPIELFGYDSHGDDFVDRAFGKDAWRNLRRYMDRARVVRVNRLSREHHDLALVLHHARSIRNCRLNGPCALRKSGSKRTAV